MAEHVLLVDDETGLREVVADYLSGLGYDMSLAGGVDEALGLAQLHPPDLVLSDLVLEDGSGLSLLKKLKNAPPPGAEPFCILMTGFGTMEHAVEALRSGVDDFLTKPFTLQDLKRALSSRGSSGRSGGADAARQASWQTLTRLRHELAAPAGRLMAYAEMLDQGLFGPLGPAQAAKIMAMQQSAARIAGALAASQHAGSAAFHTPRLERMRPEALVRGMLDEFDLDFERRGIAVSQLLDHALPEVLADRRCAHAALEALFSTLLLLIPQGGALHMDWTLDAGTLVLGLACGLEPAPGTAPALEALWLEQAGLALDPPGNCARPCLRFLHPRPDHASGH